MKHSVQAVLAALLLILTALPVMAQEKVTLVYRAQANQVVRYKADSTLTVDAGGMKMTFEQKETQKVTFTEVAANGNLTMEQESESSEVSINGNKVTVPDDDRDKITITIRPNGVLVAYKLSGGDTEKTKRLARLFPATTVIFSDKPVGVGDKWSHEYKADGDLGLNAARADFELQAFEQVGGTETVKIKMTYRETEASPPLSSSGTLWIEKSSGDTVTADMEIENIRFDDAPNSPVASGKVHQERISGAPLGGGKPAEAAKPEPKREKTVDEVVKDYEKQTGLFTVYRKKEAGRDTIYMEVREDQLGKMMMLSVIASTGTSESVVAGTPIDNIVFQFRKDQDERLLMVVPNYTFRADETSPIARSVRRSFADGYIESFKIEAKQADRKSLLINISDLFRGDIAQISALVSGGGGPPALLGGGGRGGYTMDREKTYVASLKVFPENIAVESNYHFTRSGGSPPTYGLRGLTGMSVLADPRSIPLKINYLLFPLPDNGYRPRLADPRVGYFTVDHQDFTRDGKSDPITRYITRWHLEKADPKAALSPPKKPIVFWLDNAIPTEYRDAVRDGLLYWNKAFEKIGLKEAIVVKQMPDDADFDHADLRYNMVHWVTSPDNAYAAGPPRVNPLTGEIIGANIIVDAGMVRVTKLERKRLVEPSTYFNPEAENAARAAKRLFCDMAAGAVEQAWFGQMALRLLASADAKINERAYVNDFIRSTIAHEMGHILGLRHNFISSTHLSMEALKDEKRIKSDGISASVMDYIAFNICALKKPGVDYWSPTLGPYDYWAIQYGYAPIDARTPEGELHKLQAIASRCNMPGLAYQSDEMADQFDPAVARFDLSNDPLAYWTRTLQVSRYLLLHLDKRVPKKGESYYEFTRDFNGLLNIYARAAATASRYVGGLHVNRNHRGDPREKPTLVPIDGAKQKQALQLLNTYIFAPNAFALPKSYFTRMTDRPFGEMDIETLLSGGNSYPVRDTFANIQRAALNRLFNNNVLRRIINNEFKVADASKALTLPYLFRSVGTTVWAELDSRKSIDPLRRQLQRSHLETMIGMVVTTGGAPEDAKMLAWDELRRLKAKITAAKSRQHDDYTRVHLDESLMRINRALDARITIGSQAAPQQNLLQLLLGGSEAPEGAGK